MYSTTVGENGVCALCETQILSTSIFDGERSFCCIGCKAVFQILVTKKESTSFRESEVFRRALDSGLISNPELLEQIRKNQIEVPVEERKRLHLEIGDLWCPSCAEVIRLHLMQARGVLQCVIDYATDLASIEYAPRYLSKEDIISRIQRLGYQPQFLQNSIDTSVRFSLWLRFMIAAFFSMNLMMFSYPIYASYFSAEKTQNSQLFVWLSCAASLPVLLYSGWPILCRFWHALAAGIVGMEALIVIGVSASFSLSLYEMFQGGNHVYFDSMAVIITFVLLGKIIEARAKFSTKDFLFRLVRALPRRGRKRYEIGKEIFVPVKEVLLGDEIVVLKGEKVVLDGIVIEGEGACNESVMTGESIPIRKGIGSAIMAGSILEHGHLVFRVTKKESETALYQILEMINGDREAKSIYTRAIDPIVSWFVPTVIIFAVGIACGLWWRGAESETVLLRVLSILLISCPCAIGIAAPLAESQLLNALAHQGALIRNRGVLRYLGRENVFVFDKTGTITKGYFQVHRGLEALNREDKEVLKGLAIKSAHPICLAITAAIEEAPLPLSHVKEMTGKGMEGEWNGEIYRLGSGAWVGQQDTLEPDPSASEVFFTNGSRLLACIRLKDELKEGIDLIIHSLAPIERWLLSGDSPALVSVIAHQCGFDRWKGGCVPLEKRNQIESWKKEGKIVAMLGDGINDAPALTVAHVGISVANASDLSIQVSDVLLTTSQLEVLPKIRLLARRGQQIIKQNLFWAFFYNVVGIALAAFGYLNPILASAAMAMSSLIVLFNARRIAPPTEN